MEQEEGKLAGIETKLQEDLEINEQDILHELARQPSKYYFYGTMWCKASRKSRKQRLRVKELEARLANELRKNLEAKVPGGRVTEKMINDYVNTHPEYLESEGERIQSEYMEDVLGVARDAFKQRALSLQELARQDREEQIYGNEFKAMVTEHEERVKDVGRKKKSVREEPA